MDKRIAPCLERISVSDDRSDERFGAQLCVSDVHALPTEHADLQIASCRSLRYSKDIQRPAETFCSASLVAVVSLAVTWQLRTDPLTRCAVPPEDTQKAAVGKNSPTEWWFRDGGDEPHWLGLTELDLVQFACAGPGLPAGLHKRKGSVMV